MITDTYVLEIKKHDKYTWQDTCLIFSQSEKAMITALQLTQFNIKIRESNQVRFPFHYAVLSDVLQIRKLYHFVLLLYKLNINKNKMILKLRERSLYSLRKTEGYFILYFYSSLIYHLSNVDGILTQSCEEKSRAAQLNLSILTLLLGVRLFHRMF